MPNKLSLYIFITYLNKIPTNFSILHNPLYISTKHINHSHRLTISTQKTL